MKRTLKEERQKFASNAKKYYDNYFSKKDLEVHELVLCEACYDVWKQGFVIPVRITGKQEVLS